MKPKRILAAIDRFPEDDAVLLRSIEVASRHGVALTIVHVVELPDHAAFATLITTFHGQAEFAARDRINATLHRHGVNPIEVEVHFETGAPAGRMAKICKDLKPMLVVLRTHHQPWIFNKLLGSTTEKVIAAGHAPVLFVRPSVEKPYNRVLLAVKGPDTAPTALSFVAPLLPDTKVHIIQAVAVAPQFEQAMLRVGLARMEMRAHQDVLAQDAEVRLATLVPELSPGVTWQVLRGVPAQVLARATHAPDVDLIALGPNRSGLLRWIFIGSVTRQLLLNAGCGVLISIPPDTGVPDVIARRDQTGALSFNTLRPLEI